MTKICEWCGTSYARKGGKRTEFLARRYCTRSCAMSARYAGAQANLAEDVADLLSMGESRVMVARRLGYTKASSLARRLARAGRPDLARGFWQKERAAA